MQTAIVYTSIPLSGTVSEIFRMPNAIAGGALWVPTINSCQVFLQGSFDPTSANFVRVQNSAGSGQVTLSPTVGSVYMPMKDVGLLPYGRLETTVAQSAVRSFSIVTQY